MANGNRAVLVLLLAAGVGLLGWKLLSRKLSPAVPRLVSITVTTTLPGSLGVGIPHQFTAMGTYSDGSVVDITSRVAWSSSDISLAVIDATGMATGVAGGIVYFMASLSGISSTPRKTNVTIPFSACNDDKTLCFTVIPGLPWDWNST